MQSPDLKAKLRKNAESALDRYGNWFSAALYMIFHSN